MILPNLHELAIVGVADPAKANHERVVIRPTEIVNLGQFAMQVGLRQEDGSILPLWDHFLWFGEITVVPPCWIILYTGPGKPTVTTMPDGQQSYNFHRGKEWTVFHKPNILPVLFRYDGILIGPRQVFKVPQIS
jgi:hypothetical protein